MFHTSLVRILRTFILLFVFGVTLFGIHSSAFAAGEEKYRDLFGQYTGTSPVSNGTSGAKARTESGIYYIGSTGFYNGIKEFYVGANLMFPGVVEGQTPNATIEKDFWDFVGHKNGTEAIARDTFIIRTYQIVNGQPTNYAYKQIYEQYYNPTASSSSVEGSGSGVGSTTVSSSGNASAFGGTIFKQDKYTDPSGVFQDKYKVNQKINVPIKFDTAIPYGTQMGADFWYCGGEKNNSANSSLTIDPGDFNSSNIPANLQNSANIAFFTDPELCGGTAYWKIGPSITFTLPASREDITGGAIQVDQAQSGSGYGQGGGNVSGDNLPNCSMTGGTFGSGSFTGCIAYLVYYLIYWPIAWFAGIMGQLFDFFLGYSLSDTSYRAQFAVRGWQIVRDISNIFFIIILVYTGLMAVFNTETNIKKVVSQLIINAVLINFSLFGTRVVIDLSNVVARVFYKSIEVCDGPCNQGKTNLKSGIAGFTPLSEKIVSAFNPQKIFSTETMSAATALPDNGTTSQGTKKTLDRSSSEYAGYYIVISLIAAFILFAVAMMFWKTAFFFVGRVIGLYVAMIFAPFAVLSKGGMPIVSNVKELSWSNWVDDLVKYAMLAPIFVLFLYVIYSFLETDFIKVYADKIGNSFFETVVYISIPMIIVYFMLKQGVSLAESYAGKFGKAIGGFINTAAGFVGGAALGVATGGVALAGRNVIGRLGTRVAESGALQNASSRGGVRGWLADRTMRVGGSLSRATYDARNTSLPQTLQNNLGVGITNSRIGAIIGTNTNRTTGGFRGAITREAAYETERAQRFQLTGQQAINQDNLNRSWEAAYQAARTTAQQNANGQGQVFDENNFRTSYEQQQIAVGNARPETTAQINRRREQQNNARLTRGSVLARISRTVTNRATTPAGTVGVAANALGAVIAGNTAIAAATIVGQGAIENAAQQQVAQARAGAARAPLNPTQIQNLQNRITQLQNELTRRIAFMTTIGNSFRPTIAYGNLTPANIIDYQTDRQNDINSLQVSIDAEQDFIDRNKNNPAQTNAVNNARSTIRSYQNDQNTHRNNLRQAGTILTEYARIQSDMDSIRSQLVNN